MGRAQEAEAHVLEALRLSPRDAMIFEWFLIAGQAKTLLGEFAEAATWPRKSIDANRNRPLAFFLLAACLVHLDRLDEARREVNAGLAVDPKFSIARFRAGCPKRQRGLSRPARAHHRRHAPSRGFRGVSARRYLGLGQEAEPSALAPRPNSNRSPAPAPVPPGPGEPDRSPEARRP